MTSAKRILITGTSTGFGRLAVPLLLKRGHLVICGMRGGQQRLETLYKEELGTFPGRLFAVDLPMENPESFQLAREFIEKHCDGKLDVLINNAGYGLFGAVEDQSEEQIRHQFDVNVFGPIFLTRSLLPALRAARGRIINLSSVAGLLTFPLYSSYCSSKYAIESFSEGLYYELKPHGVQVALVEPGGFKTDFSSRSVIWGAGSENPASPYRARTEVFKKTLARTAGRLGDPQKVAKLIVRLSEKKKIRLRNVIGSDARMMNAFRSLTPSCLRVPLIDFIWRKVAFKE